MVKYKNEKRIQGAGFQMLNKSLKKKVVLTAINAAKVTIDNIVTKKTHWIDFEQTKPIIKLYLNDEIKHLYEIYDPEDFVEVVNRLCSVFGEVYQSVVLGDDRIQFKNVCGEVYKVWSKPDISDQIRNKKGTHK